MAQFKITIARLCQIKRRQREARRGPDYVAGIWADPKEAPGNSTGAICRLTKVGAREWHTLSADEKFFSLLFLKNLRCWDLREQRIMFPLP